MILSPASIWTPSFFRELKEAFSLQPPSPGSFGKRNKTKPKPKNPSIEKRIKRKASREKKYIYTTNPLQRGSIHPPMSPIFSSCFIKLHASPPPLLLLFYALFLSLWKCGENTIEVKEEKVTHFFRERKRKRAKEKTAWSQKRTAELSAGDGAIL